MSVSSTTSRVQYTLSTTTQTLAVPFFFIEASHLKVFKAATAGTTPTVLALGTHYTVAGAGVEAGGSITMTGVGVAVADKITIRRVVPETQLVNYIPNDRFPAPTHERALDKVTMLVQMQAEEASRSLRVEEGETLDGTMTLAARKGKVPTFNATTGALEWIDQANQVQAAASAAEAAAAAAAAAAYQAKIEVATIAALKLLSTVSFVSEWVAQVNGYYAAGDGGGGLFRWVPASVATDNGGTVIAPTLGSGRWLRIFSGNMDGRWWGMRDDSTFNSGISFAKLLNYAHAAGGATVTLPKGSFWLSHYSSADVGEVVCGNQVSTGPGVVAKTWVIPDNFRFIGEPGTKVILSAAEGNNLFGYVQGWTIVSNGPQIGASDQAWQAVTAILSETGGAEKRFGVTVSDGTAYQVGQSVQLGRLFGNNGLGVRNTASREVSPGQIFTIKVIEGDDVFFVEAPLHAYYKVEDLYLHGYTRGGVPVGFSRIWIENIHFTSKQRSMETEDAYILWSKCAELHLHNIETSRTARMQCGMSGHIRVTGTYRVAASTAGVFSYESCTSLFIEDAEYDFGNTSGYLLIHDNIPDVRVGKLTIRNSSSFGLFMGHGVVADVGHLKIVNCANNQAATALGGKNGAVRLGRSIDLGHPDLADFNGDWNRPRNSPLGSVVIRQLTMDCSLSSVLISVNDTLVQIDDADCRSFGDQAPFRIGHSRDKTADALTPGGYSAGLRIGRLNMRNTVPLAVAFDLARATAGQSGSAAVSTIAFGGGITTIEFTGRINGAAGDPVIGQSALSAGMSAQAALIVSVISDTSVSVAGDMTLVWPVGSKLWGLYAEPDITRAVQIDKYLVDSVLKPGVEPADYLRVFVGRVNEAAFTVDAGTDVVSAAGHVFTASSFVRLRNTGGALPAGLSPGVTYFPRDIVAGVSFKLAATSGGAAIDITGTGTGTHYVYNGYSEWAWSDTALPGVWRYELVGLLSALTNRCFVTFDVDYRGSGTAIVQGVTSGTTLAAVFVWGTPTSSGGGLTAKLFYTDVHAGSFFVEVRKTLLRGFVGSYPPK
jgi:phage gp46-like protein